MGTPSPLTPSLTVRSQAETELATQILEDYFAIGAVEKLGKPEDMKGKKFWSLGL